MYCRYNGITKIPISAIHLVKKYSTSNFLKFGHNRLRCRYITVFFRRAIMAVADKNIVFFIHTAVYSSNNLFVYKRFSNESRYSTFLQIYKKFSFFITHCCRKVNFSSGNLIPQPITTPTYSLPSVNIYLTHSWINPKRSFVFFMCAYYNPQDWQRLAGVDHLGEVKPFITPYKP